jgi:hypothetical protein
MINFIGLVLTVLFLIGLFMEGGFFFLIVQAIGCLIGFVGLYFLFFGWLWL